MPQPTRINHNFFRQSARSLAAISLAIALGSNISGCATIAQNVGGSDRGHNGHGSSDRGGMEGHHTMDLGPADADYDLRFLDAMIPHHEGAVVMAKDVLEKSKRPELLKLAKNIIAAQDKEIAQMQQWRQKWYPKAPTAPMGWHSDMGHMMEMSKEQIDAMRMDMDLGAADAEYDLRFINAMIPHHEGALVMAEDLLLKSKRPEMQKLAQDILKSQQAEIEQMKQWRQSWYDRQASQAVLGFLASIRACDRAAFS